jgi:hypothetical protein
MNRIAKLALVLFVACPALLGQEKASMTNPNASRSLSHEVFLVKHRDPVEIVKVINVLGSGSPDALMEANKIDNDIRTITVRDFPESIAVIKKAIEKLDVPAPKSTPVILKIDVLWASKKEFPKNEFMKKELPKAPISPYLSDVVAEISKTLNYKYFHEATTITSVLVNNSASGRAVFGYPDDNEDRLKFLPFEWELIPNVNSVDADYVVSGKMNIKYREKSVHGGVSFNNVNIELKDKEKRMLGTSFGDIAMIVVISAERL